MRMIRARHGLLAFALAGIIAPAGALAQHAGHEGMQMPMQHAHAPAPARKKTPAPNPAVRHEHHAPPATTEPSVPPPPSATPDAPGEAPSTDTPPDHAGMGHAAHTAPDLPRTPLPVVTDADRAAAVPPPADHPVHDNTIRSYTVLDRLEAWDAKPGTGFEWEGESWIGTDLDRLWLRSEGERRASRTEAGDLEVLYGRSVAAWWDVVAGVRHDFRPGASQDFAAIGVMGLAPYKFEVAATAYIGQSGQAGARVDVEYEALFTNRLILQPLLEVNLYGQDDARRGIGSGLSSVEAGLRLRYEVTRRFAPYIGLVHERAFGRTADFRRAGGEDVEDTRLVAGVRMWF